MFSSSLFYQWLLPALLVHRCGRRRAQSPGPFTGTPRRHHLHRRSSGWVAAATPVVSQEAPAIAPSKTGSPHVPPAQAHSTPGTARSCCCLRHCGAGRTCPCQRSSSPPLGSRLRPFSFTSLDASPHRSPLVSPWWCLWTSARSAGSHEPSGSSRGMGNVPLWHL